MAKKKSHKHVSKAELMRKMKELSLAKKSTNGATFTGMVTLFNYVLWKDCNYDTDKLIEFNQAMLKYNRADDLNIKELSDKLMDYAEFSIEYIPDTSAPRVKNKALNLLESQIDAANDKINVQSSEHLLCGFNALIDIEVLPDEIVEIKDKMNDRLGIMFESGGVRIMDMHQELYDELGLYIDMPDPSSRAQYMSEEDEVTVL